MMARVNDADVRCLIPSTTLTDLSAFIASSEIMVDDVASNYGSEFTDGKLKEIQRWLTAHLVAVVDPTVAIIEEKVEGSTVKAARGNTQLAGILSTQFGQMANSLSNGHLAELDKPRPSVSFI